MKRVLVFGLLLTAACPGDNTNGNTNGTSPQGTNGTSGTTNNNNNNTNTDPTAVCDGGASTCSKWLSQCKKDCKVIGDATKRTECTTGCDDALPDCVSACKDASDPAKWDAKLEDWDGKPEPPKPTSDECGGADQECCADDSGFDACQEGMVKLEGDDGQGNTLCGCATACKKNILDQKNKQQDDCDETHICIALDYTKAPSTTNPLSCLPAMCDPTAASGKSDTLDPGCGYPQPRCGGIFTTKPKFGFCNPHCVPHSADLGCTTAGQVCYPTYTMVQSGQQSQILQLNVCGTKTGSVADGAACTFAIAGAINTGYTASENCAADTFCDITQPAGANRKCRKSCGVDGANGVTGDNTACASATVKSCHKFLGNLSGVTGLTGITGGQLAAAAEQQGPMYFCK